MNIEDQLLDKIDQWHEDKTIEIPLYEYLGMTWEEYKEYVKNNHFGQCYWCKSIIKEGQKAIPFALIDIKWFCCDICFDNFIHSK